MKSEDIKNMTNEQLCDNIIEDLIALIRKCLERMYIDTGDEETNTVRIKQGGVFISANKTPGDIMIRINSKAII